MVWIPALSLQEQVERVGAYVGIASFFGIALLAVLYFAQARELKRLRDWAGRAPERARELEERVAEDAARRADEQARTTVAATEAGVVTVPVAVPAPGAGGAADPESQPAGAEDPGASGAAEPATVVEGAPGPVAGTAGVNGSAGAGAGAGATIVDPGGAVTATPEDQDSPAVPGTDEGNTPPTPVVATPDGVALPPLPVSADGDTTREGPAAVPVTSVAGATAEPAHDAPGVDAGNGPQRDVDAGDGPGREAPDVDAGDRPGRDEDQEVGLPGADDLAASPTAAAVPAGPRPATAAALRVGAPPTRVASRPAPLTPVAPSPRRRGRGPLIGLAAAGLLAAGVGAFALAGDDDDPAPEPNVAATATPAPTAAATATADVAAARGETTVAVLNGTTTNGLAARLVERLTAAGYQEGPRGNYADQQRATSVVLHRDGAEDRARDVASVLDIAEVAPIDAQTAGQPIGDAQVVVVAGHDQAP